MGCGVGGLGGRMCMSALLESFVKTEEVVYTIPCYKEHKPVPVEGALSVLFFFFLDWLQKFTIGM